MIPTFKFKNLIETLCIDSCEINYVPRGGKLFSV